MLDADMVWVIVAPFVAIIIYFAYLAGRQRRQSYRGTSVTRRSSNDVDGATYIPIADGGSSWGGWGDGGGGGGGCGDGGGGDGGGGGGD